MSHQNHRQALLVDTARCFDALDSLQPEVDFCLVYLLQQYLCTRKGLSLKRFKVTECLSILENYYIQPANLSV